MVAPMSTPMATYQSQSSRASCTEATFRIGPNYLLKGRTGDR